MKERIESLDKFIISINEKFDINVEDENYDAAKEKKAAQDFIVGRKYTVVNVKANIIDDYNTNVKITISNDDEIEYNLKETKYPVKGQISPPFCNFSFKVNDKEYTNDLEDVITGDSGTIIGDILRYYKKIKK
jgi:hypothetical protein